MARYWGFWTRGKLDILRRYLDAFTTASKSRDEIIYLDLFGGQPGNLEASPMLISTDQQGSRSQRPAHRSPAFASSSWNPLRAASTARSVRSTRTAIST